MHLKDREKLPKSLLLLRCYGDYGYITPVLEFIRRGQDTQGDMWRLSQI